MANQVYMYQLREGKSVEGAVECLRNFFFAENMECQSFNTGNGYIVQARVRSGGVKQLIGMDKAVEVRFNMVPGSNQITVEMGGAKWADKAAVMAVSMFVLWPLAITSGVGIYGQKKVLDKAKTVIEQYFYF